MPERIPAGVAKTVVFRAISSTDHFTPKISVVPVITIWETGDGAAFKNPAAGALTATEIASGFYKFALGATDVNVVGPMAWRAAVSGMDDVGDVYEVVAATNAGFSALPDTACTTNASLITAGTGTSQLSVGSGLVTLAAVTHTGAVIPTVTTTTTATNLTNERGKYMHGAVWIGSVANTNTTIYVDGIMTNPVSTMAAALSVAGNTGLRRFWVQAGVTATLSATVDGYVFDGFGWKLALAAQNISNSVFSNCINVTGTSTSTSATSFPYFIDCEFGATATVPPANFNHCEFVGTLTLGAAGNYDFIDCASIVAGTSAPAFAVPAGTVNISFRRWSGGISISGITSATTISIDAVSGGTVTLTGADGNVQVRGMVAIDDQRTGTPTLGKTQVVTPKTIWQDAVAGDFTAASSIGKALFIDAVPGATGGHFIAGTNAATTVTTALTTTFTGNLTGSVATVAANGITATSIAADALNAAAVKADAVTKIQNGLATPTNITAAAGIAVASIGNNVITAASVNAAALNGKGDWNVGKTGYALTQTFPANFADMTIAVTTGIVDANIQKINDVTITGDGQPGTEFGV